MTTNITSNKFTTDPNRQNLFDGEMGLIPPQAVDLEKAVIGIAMLSISHADQLLDEIKSSDVFYKTSHGHIYNAIKALNNSKTGKSNVDILTVVEQLKKDGKLEEAGGAYEVTAMTSQVSSTINFDFYVKVIKEKYMGRKLIEICRKAQHEAYRERKDIFDLLSETETAISRTFTTQVGKDTRIMQNAFNDALNAIKTKIKEKREGVNSDLIYCFNDIDRMTGGLHRGDLTIIAARPGMGKTAFALTLARNVAVNIKKPTVFFTLEVTESQIVTRLMSMESGVELSYIRDARLEEWQVDKISSMSDLIESNLFIDDTPGITVQELRSKCRRLKNKFGIELIIVDYIQLLRTEYDKSRRLNRDQEIGEISRSLKGLAKELNVPVVALSQLSRSVESRTDKRPMLSDLRESGNIEQDADNVAFLYRPDYYGITINEEGDSTEGLTEFIMAKHRHGQIGAVNLLYRAELTRFENNLTPHVKAPVKKQQKPRKKNTALDYLKSNDKFDDVPF